MAIAALLIGIPVLILLHELGHFLVAKWSGVKVLEFGFGFPPRLFSKKVRGTIYSFNAIPFGGFVRLYGENDTEENADPKDGSTSFDSAQDMSLTTSLFYTQPWGKRVGIIGAGVLMNFILGWLLMATVFAIGAPKSVLVAGIAPGSPAASAGIVAGDKIEGYEDATSFIEAMKGSLGKPISVAIRHAGEEQPMTVSVVPRVNPPAGEGAVGVQIEDVGFKRRGIFTALGESFLFSLKAIGFVFASLWGLLVGLFLGGGAPTEQFVGPVGIFGVANQVAGFGAIYLVQLLAIISLNLAALNILPIPALDGGRLLFIVIEKIRGKRVRPERETMSHAVGFGLLLLLMLILTIRDIAKLV